jgi:hypothetical protein
MSEIFGEQTLSTFARCIDEWIASIAAQNPAILTFQRDEGPDRRWYVRMRGEEKEFTTIWLWLGQRTLKYETYVMPAPAENAEALYEHVLRRNDKLVGAHFSIGIEDAIFLRGDMPLSVLSEEELDRAIGTLYATVELVFPTIIRMGFASHFNDTP